MALKRNDEAIREESLSERKAKEVFSKKEGKEKKIEPSFKEELEELFDSMGLGWAAGIRFALKEFSKKYGNN